MHDPKQFPGRILYRWATPPLLRGHELPCLPGQSDVLPVSCPAFDELPLRLRLHSGRALPHRPSLDLQHESALLPPLHRCQVLWPRGMPLPANGPPNRAGQRPHVFLIIPCLDTRVSSSEIFPDLQPGRLNKFYLSGRSVATHSMTPQVENARWSNHLSVGLIED